MCLPGRLSEWLSRRDLCHSEAKVWIYGLRISSSGRALHLKRFIHYTFPLLLDWLNSACVSGGRPLLFVLRRTRFHIGANFVSDGTNHSRRNFRRICEADCLAYQTHLEGRRRGSRKRKRGLFRDHDTGSSGESAGNVARYIILLSLW